MNRNFLTLLMVLVVAASLLFGLFYYLGGKQDTASASKTAIARAGNGTDDETPSSSATSTSSPLQDELNKLAAKRLRELHEEQRLHLSIGATLKSYQEMFRQIHQYSKAVENDLNIIEQISKEEFQDDVKQIASLFGGKKPELVAKHLEEFRAARVGAVLAKMKEKEAAAVLDTWAKQGGKKVSTFYREVMAAYLNNKRRDANPELFQQITQGQTGENARDAAE